MTHQPRSSNRGSDPTQLSTALAYAARGWRVFPLHSPTRNGGCTCGQADCGNIGKHPRTLHGVKDASNSVPVLNVWWGEQWQRANIGIATGARSGIVVLDIDPRHGGEASLQQLQETHGALPETLRVATGGGGEHWYFIHPGDVVLNNRTQVAGLSGLDARGDGGYVVAPRSWHASGARYEWIDPAMSLAPLPEWLLGLLMKPIVAPIVPIEQALPVGDADDTSRYWLERALDQAGEGTRNVTGFWLACQLRDAGLSQSVAEACMNEYAARVPGDGYTLREAQNSLRQAYGGAARAKARSQSLRSISGGYSYGEAYAALAPRTPTTLAEARQAREEPTEASAAEAQRRARFALLSDEEVEALPPPSWQIANLLVQDTLSVVYGEFGSAKSFLVLDWALSIATGTPWMGKQVEQGPVVYIAGEGIGGMGRRIKAWKQYHNWQSGPTGLWLVGTPPLLLRPEDVQYLREAIRELEIPPAMVVIDTLARSMTGGDENSAQDMGMAVAAAESLRAEFGCHILLVHHKPAGASKTRGSTALPGAADTLIDVTKDGDHIVVSCEKQKDGAPFERIHCKLLVRPITEDGVETSCVLVPTSNQSLPGGLVNLPRSAENVLTLLREQPSQSARFAELARLMEGRYGMVKSSVANALTRLQEARLVTNTNSPQGPVWLVIQHREV